jgi:hypothetical protein
MKNKLIAFGILVMSFLSPVLAFAEEVVANDFTYVIAKIAAIVGMLMPILITIAAVWFVWNVILYAVSGDEDKKKKAKDGIITGLIGLLVIVAFWGIIAMAMKTFGLNTDSNFNKVPDVPIVTM